MGRKIMGMNHDLTFTLTCKSLRVCHSLNRFNKQLLNDRHERH